MDASFFSSEPWIEYSHKRYLTLDEIWHRIKNRQDMQISKETWDSTLKKQFLENRKNQAIHFDIKSINKTFWFFFSDSIRKNLDEIEKTGAELVNVIKNAGTFKTEFIINAAAEEAITSALYEGANSTRAKARQLIASEKKPANKDEWMLVNNYEAMLWIKKNLHRNVAPDLVRELHTIVTKNTLAGDDVNYTGKFRDDVVYVGEHEGVDYKLIEESLSKAMFAIMNCQRYLHPLIKAMLLHYFVAYIHPFFDGNGRTARTLFYFKALKNKMEFVELLSISASLKEHGRRYERAFENAVAHDGDITFFVGFCLDSVIFALEKVRKKIDYLMNISKLAGNHKLKTSQIVVLQRLALNKFRGISAEEHAKSINRSREHARQELKELANLAFLDEREAGKKSIFFVNSKKLKEIVFSD